MQKRANVFGQGRPERPYEERDEPAEIPQRATAAQLATRKIKSAKVRRPAGAASNLGHSASFGGPQQSGFNFGNSAPADANNNNMNNISPTTNGFGFDSTSAFGSAATSSFPPAQSSTPSNNFTNSSFPVFGASAQTTGFNPQPPSTGFNFTAGSSNPFNSAGSAPTKNGADVPSAFGGSVFGSQQPSNPFGGLTQNSTVSAVPGGQFGATAGASNTGLFGSVSSSAPKTISTPAPAPPTLNFGAASSFGQNNVSTPATSNLFSGFHTSTPAAAPAQSNMFSGFSTNLQKSEPVGESAAPQNTFSGFGANKQNIKKTSVSAPTPGLFNFSSTAQTHNKAENPALSAGLFSSSSIASPSLPEPGPASNPSATLPSTPTVGTSFFNSTSAQQTPQAQEKATATSNNLFSSLKPAGQSDSTNAEKPKPNLFASLSKPNSTTVETPKPNLFASLAKPSSTPAAMPATGTSSFSIFGASQNRTADSGPTEKTPGTATSKAPEAPRPILFNGFSTHQPTETDDTEKAPGGLSSAAQPKINLGIISQNLQPENSSNLFKAQSTLSRSPLQATSSTETLKDINKEQSGPTEGPDFYPSAPMPSVERQNLFKPSSPSPTFSMPTLTESTNTATETSNDSPNPLEIPKVHVPREWVRPGAVGAPGLDGMHYSISSLTAQLQDLNTRYRQQLSNLPPTADWSSLSLWHYQHAADIKRQIDDARKQRAAAKGVTGHESALSTKRKVNDDSHGTQDPSPFKRARAADAPTTPTPKATIPAPNINPSTVSTTNLFTKAIGNSPAAPSAPTNLFNTSTTRAVTNKPSKPVTPNAGFTPTYSSSNVLGGSNPAPTSSGFNPNIASSTKIGSGGFFSQFAKTAKTYEQLAAERKAKAKAEDYDSDDETEEEWSAKYDQKEAERLTEEKKQVASTPTFSAPASIKSSGNTTLFSNPFGGLTKPTSGTTSPALFTPRFGSPASSTGGQSVFDALSATQTPSANIFGHLSSGPSSNNQEESDADDSEQAKEKLQQDRPVGSVEPLTPPKRKYGDSETESDETLEETMRRKKQETGSKGSLLSRMSKFEDKDAESAKENTNSIPSGQTNGTQTPISKPFQFFDFGAAGSTKKDMFAGDQTYKHNTPIKFGASTAEKQGTAPMFQFQPATPSAAEFSTTPAKPPPSLFNPNPTITGPSLLAPNAGLFSGGSVTSSVFSSRAPTPLSEADASATSVAEDDEEGSKQAQVDFSQLTEEETDANDIVFHTELVLVKHHVDSAEGGKAWANLARGPLWILKDKVTAKCFIRVRLTSGATPLNYQILPALHATVTGGSKKMVLASKPAKDGGFQQVLFAVKTTEIAEEFARNYNNSLPSN